MKKRLLTIAPYLIGIVLAFYIIPLLGRSTGGFMIILLIAVPVICFVMGLLYGRKAKFRPWFALLTAALFIPSIFLYYNSSAWVYSIAFGVMTLFGNGIGCLIWREKR